MDSPAFLFKVLPLRSIPYTVQLYAISPSIIIYDNVVMWEVSRSLSKGTREQSFGILALNSVFHLILDSLQTKWGNGVHLFAPVSWEVAEFRIVLA